MPPSDYQTFFLLATRPCGALFHLQFDLGLESVVRELLKQMGGWASQVLRTMRVAGIAESFEPANQYYNTVLGKPQIKGE